MNNVEFKRIRLLEIARRQGGCFTAAQAASIGFDNANQFLLVEGGRWERLRRGIFRLTSEPRGEFDDLHALALFFRHRDGSPSGIFGLETAAVVHGMGDFMPGQITVLVKPSFRKRATLPNGVELVRTLDLATEIQHSTGLPVTSPLRTIVDLMAAPERDREEIRRAFLSARRDGFISMDALAAMKIWVRDDSVTAIIRDWEKSLHSKPIRRRNA